MYLGMIVGRAIEVSHDRGKSGVCRSDSAGDQLDITQETYAYRNQSLVIHCVKDDREIPPQYERR
jgi:hypothetical protein